MGNINDNKEEVNLKKIDANSLPELEQFMLHKIYLLNENFKKYFKNYDFHNLYKELLNFCTVDLSAFYFDIRKDCLYCDHKKKKKRQSSILLLKVILTTLLRWFAPILSFTTEEIYKIVGSKKSIHLEKFIDFPINFKNDNLNSKWLELIKIRDVCNLSIEEKRAEKIIGSSLEASIKIRLDKEKLKIFSDIDFAELCITSNAQMEESKDNKISVETFKAEGTKCPLCWKIRVGSCLRNGKKCAFEN